MNRLFVYQKERLFPKGFVADYCPIEGDVKEFEVSSVFNSWFINFLPVAKGPFLRRDRTCSSCGVTIHSEAASYRATVPQHGIDLTLLEAETNPGVSDRCLSLIQLRRSIEGGEEVDPGVREDLILEQFAFLEETARVKWGGETRVDTTSFVFAAACALLTFGLFVGLPPLVPKDQVLNLFMAIFVLGILLMISSAVVFFRYPHRYLQREVIPKLAIALRPLRPTRADLDAILKSAREAGFRYCSRVDPVRLLRQIDTGRQSPRDRDRSCSNQAQP